MSRFAHLNFHYMLCLCPSLEIMTIRKPNYYLFKAPTAEERQEWVSALSSTTNVSYFSYAEDMLIALSS